MKKAIVIIFAAMLCLLAASYYFDPGRRATLRALQEKGKQTTKDIMLSSQSVTSIACDRRELMWIGTSAGVNVYDGKNFVQFGYDIKDTTALPDDHDNIVAIEDSREKDDSMAVLVSDGNRTFHISGDEKITPSHRQIQPNHFQASLPKDLSILRKPVEVVSATFKDHGDNLWVGYRNSGFQVISQNLIAYKKANDNPLTKATKGMAMLCMAAVGNHLLAGTALRVFIYDLQNRRIGQTPFRNIFDSVPAPQKINLNNIVMYDDEHAWMVSGHQVASCRISDECADVLHKSPVLKSLLGYGLKVGDALYVCSEGRNLLRFRFGNLQPDTIPIPNANYDHETKMEKLADGNILLFMQGMHLAILSPKTGKIKEMKVAGMPVYGNFDPAFAKQDSYGNVWLGTKRDGLYLIDMKKKTMGSVKVLNDTHIKAMVEDCKRQLWVTTMRDAFFVTFKSKTFMMSSLLSASQDRYDWQFYNNSICLSPEGDVVFGSSDGCKFMPQEAMYTDLPLGCRRRHGCSISASSPWCFISSTRSISGHVPTAFISCRNSGSVNVRSLPRK